MSKNEIQKRNKNIQIELKIDGFGQSFMQDAILKLISATARKNLLSWLRLNQEERQKRSKKENRNQNAIRNRNANDNDKKRFSKSNFTTKIS